MRVIESTLSTLGMYRHFARLTLSAEQRRIGREVRSKMDLPRLPSSPRRKGGIWAIAMVKNEQDVLRASVMHQFEQGIDAMLVADNGSEDGTLDLLHDLAREYPVFIANDRLTTYHQAAKTSLLAREVAKAGATWVVPFDADEFWFATDHTLAEHLRTSQASVEIATMYNLFPLSGDNVRFVDREAAYRLDRSPSSFRKVCFRAHPLARLSAGNHGVARGGTKGSGLIVAHLPWRSFEQFAQKVRQGKRAVEGTRYGGRHWLKLGDLDLVELNSRWNRVLMGEPDVDNTWAPVGPFVERRVLRPGPTTWRESAS